MNRLLLILILLLSPFIASAYDYEVFTLNGKQGLKDDKGIIVIPANFDALGWSFSAGEVKNRRIGFLKDGKWGVLSIQNEILYPAVLEAVFDATANVIVAGQKNINGRYKKGVISYTGKVLVPFQYRMIDAYDNRLVVFQDNKYGLLDFEGKVVMPFEYEHISQVDNLRWFAGNTIEEGFLFNNKGEKVSSEAFDFIESFRNGVAIVHKNHLRGLIDSNGKWLLKPAFKNIIISGGEASGIPYNSYKFYNDKAISWSADSVNALEKDLFQLFASGKTCLTDQNQNLLFPGSDAISYHNNLLVVKKESGTGVFDRNLNKWIADPLYDDIIFTDMDLILLKERGDNGFSIINKKGEKENYKIEGFKTAAGGLMIKKNNAWGFINETGKEILPPVYDQINSISDNKFSVTFHGDHGIVDHRENWLVVPQKDEIISFNRDIYISFDGKLYNMLDYQNERIYFSIYPLSLGPGYVIEDRGNGNVVRLGYDGISIKSIFKKAQYEEVLPLSEGLIGVVHRGQYGFIDPEGRLRISNRYQGVTSFINGLASVKLNARWGVINKREQLVVQPLYDHVGSFENNNAVARKDDLFGVIDSSGKIIIPLEYDSVSSFNGKYYLLQKRDEFGVAERTGRILIAPKYDEIIYSNENFVVRKDQYFGLHDAFGVAVLPPMYEIIIPVPGGDDFIIGEKQIKVTVPLN